LKNATALYRVSLEKLRAIKIVEKIPVFIWPIPKFHYRVQKFLAVRFATIIIAGELLLTSLGKIDNS
jgi:hypothetical protein